MVIAHRKQYQITMYIIFFEIKMFIDKKLKSEFNLYHVK